MRSRGDHHQVIDHNQPVVRARFSDGTDGAWCHTFEVNLAALIVSSLSLIAVVIIGYRSIKLGERSAKASEESAKASEGAAKASKDSAISSSRAAEATERSVVASERAAVLAAQDAQVRRLEAVLDVVLNMRQIFNEQQFIRQPGHPPPTPEIHSPEALARLALIRKLEARLVPFDEKFDTTTPTRILTNSYLWSTIHLEGSIDELKKFLKETANPSA